MFALFPSFIYFSAPFLFLLTFFTLGIISFYCAFTVCLIILNRDFSSPYIFAFCLQLPYLAKYSWPCPFVLCLTHSLVS